MNGHLPIVSVILLVGVVLLYNFPRYTDHDEAAIRAHLTNISRDATSIPVMTFNMRLDCEESDPNNHYTKRIHRINELFRSFEPWLVGLQEPFAGQLLHLQSYLPKHLNVIGYNRNEHDLGHPSRHNDFQVGMIYDARHLHLEEQDYYWLSETPRIPESKSWNSMGIRTINIARFTIRDGVLAGTHLIAFNTHLDVRSEDARRHQASIAADIISRWKVLYPHAVFMMFGDFNSVPGQGAHRILTSQLSDAWTNCSLSHSCTTNAFGTTFHGWLGTFANVYLARPLQVVAFTLSGLGLDIPHAIPQQASQWARALARLFAKAPQYSLLESLPAWPYNRLHVDWILYHHESSPESSTVVVPSLVAVIDVRSTNFSSDHFPVVGVFTVGRK
eukprot:TRINITY_DN5800_c0_g1_i5.p1 TRINITY_DN5800_c0_g1~~TRINITY_DN5800_c0_g1_i5.p1  ORF type:complete len:388 (-),score=27.70 TRINITY_DN5800_c0_g1_i5:63-1226(-)